MAVSEISHRIRAFKIALADKLASFGFKRLDHDDSVDASFWRLGESRSLRFGIGIVDYETVVCLRATAGIRFEQIEAICNEASGLPADMHAETCTLDAPDLVPDCKPDENVGRLAVGDPDSSVHRIVAEAERILVTSAAPFFDQFKTVQDVDRLLNTSPMAVSPFLTSEYERCCRSLVAAKLAGRPDIQALLGSYIGLMRTTANGFYLSRFLRLVKALSLG